MKYRDSGEVTSSCPSCLAWSIEVDRVALLLESLAEDHFPDQESFDRWMNEQMRITLRPPQTPES